jgi:hypothetical protein
MSEQLQHQWEIVRIQQQLGQILKLQYVFLMLGNSVKGVERHSREILNHFKRIRRMPDTALAVISRDLIASVSSMGRSAGSTAFCVGKGISAGSCALFWPGKPVRRLTSDRNAGARP